MKTSLLAAIAVATILSGTVPTQAPSGMRMNDPPKSVSATGMVEKVGVAKRWVNRSHGPIPAIDWPAMAMDVAVASGVDLSGVKPGQAVEPTLVSGQGKDYVVISVKPNS